MSEALRRSGPPTSRAKIIALIGLVLIVAVLVLPRIGVVRRLMGKRTVEDRLRQYGPAARERMAPAFREAGIEYPPSRVVMLVIKNERRLQLYAANQGGQPEFIRSYEYSPRAVALGRSCVRAIIRCRKASTGSCS